MDNQKQKYLTALAGLFHDIGKFYQRATNTKTSTEEKSQFGYAHAVLSAKAIKEELNEGLSAVFSPEEIDFILEGTYHHKPKNPIQYLMQKADWVSSSEREKAEAEYLLTIDELKEEIKNLSEKNPRLRSIFERLELGKNLEKRGFVYKITPLELNDDIFPLHLEEDVHNEIAKSFKEIEQLLGSYKTHWNAFKEEFNQKLKDSKLKFSENPEKVFSLIYHIFYKYLWCIPASTYDRENYSSHYPDISLFDHSRVLSAVACCFYDYDKDGFQQKTPAEFEEKLKDKNVFLHLKGDISGIQKFIYNVYQGKGGIAKTLRGRSFYVAMLPEVLSRYILNELGYPISNLLYSGGGIFEILVANTEENRKKLKEIEDKINEFLARKFEADLGLSIGTYEYSPVELMTNYENILERLNESLDNAKKQKFKVIIESGNIFKLLNSNSKKLEEENKKKKKCPVCQTYLIDENLEGDNELCAVCKEFRDIGDNLPRTETLVFAKESTQNFVENKKLIDFGDFGIVYLLTKDNFTDLQPIYFDKKTTEILDINDTKLDKYITGFKFIGKSVPEVKEKEKLSPEETGEEEPIHSGQIAPFTYLAKLSDGDERIGILRMDVDNLGKLFSKGLKGKISISRIATLSRSLDLFFAGYLNKITQKLTDRYKDKIENLKVDNLFYILYSGGDDVFLVAPWDKAIEISQKINEEFSKYTCKNPNVSISAGYLQTKPKFPIRVSAEMAGETEDRAKKAGKDRICVLGDVFKWEELKDIKAKVEEWAKKIKGDQLQRGFIYAVHRLKEQFLKDEQERSKLVFPYKREENPMFYPYAQYYIARNIKSEELKEEIAKFLLDKKNFNKLTFTVNYVALKTRK
ncbi:MAG: type III-A CRISPR-associated protein Cas10/Csm1 [Aquificae bacterium]|nr:type III-A CRISPR-associated protein Cas10/Csm1 [Aquificota bacterium]